jgi:hypothetical protein
MWPPYGVGYQTVVANGRTYNGVPGTSQDIPDFDAAVLAANGWTKVSLVGPTSSRPNSSMNAFLPNRIDVYFDTTLGTSIKWDGQVWRRIDTSASV